MMSMTDLVSIGVETPKVDGGCSLDKIVYWIDLYESWKTCKLYMKIYDY